MKKTIMKMNMMRSMTINRTDLVTNKIFDRSDLIRISIDKKGVTKIDYNHKLGGRGIYIHPSSIEKGLQKNIIKKKINRFSGNLEDIIEDLKKEIKNG